MFTAVGGIASAACAGLFLLLPEKTGMRMLPHFVSFATGALIGAALLGLLPEAMEAVGPGGAHSIGIALVAGLGVFFIIEKLVLWRHAHSHEHEDPGTREVVAHGVTGALAYDDVPADAPAPVSATPAKVAVPAGRTAMAFAGDVGGHAGVSLAQEHSHLSHAAHDPGDAFAQHAHGSGHGHGSTHGRGSAHHHHPVHDSAHDVSQDHGTSRGHDHSRGPERGASDGHDQPHGHEHGASDGHDQPHGHDHSGAQGVLVLIGDSIHNALDGILIAAAFLTNVPLGLVTTVAVAAHEIPHRVGDFALLLHAGMSRQRALFLNMATGLASVLGGIVAYFGLSRAQQALPYALALAAAGFLYIAVAGLIPGLHRRADPRTSLAQVLLMSLGVGVIAVAESLTRH
jgi:zinc transporter ZupT